MKAPARFWVAAAGLAMAASPLLFAQAPAKGTPKARIARTADGHPDLQGVWSYATITPLERPADLKDKAFLTPEEQKAYEKLTIERGDKDKRLDDKVADVGAAYNDFWWDRGTSFVGTHRTSIIIDPPNGLLPPLVPEAEKRIAALNAARPRNRDVADNPEDRSLAERCLVSLNAGPPMIPSAYNNNIQIFQTPDTIGFTNEMIHNYRVVPLDSRARPKKDVHLWMGTSRGHWEGDTLVVENLNFRPQGTFRGIVTDNLKITERFTRIDAKTLMYEFTMDDPHTWARPWTGQMPMTKIDEKMYEYACHEGNEAMTNMLRGARIQEMKPSPAKGSE